MQDMETMQDMEVTARGYDFGAAHAAMRRYVDLPWLRKSLLGNLGFEFRR